MLTDPFSTILIYQLYTHANDTITRSMMMMVIKIAFMTTTYLENSVTLWVPLLDKIISLHLHKLVQYRYLTASTRLGTLLRVVQVTIDFVIVLIVCVIRTKHCIAHGASEAAEMKLLSQSIDIRLT